MPRPETLPYDAEKEVAETVGRRTLDELHDRRQDHEPADALSILAWLMEMDDNQVIALMAPLIAGAVDAGSSDWSGGPGRSLAAQAAQTTGLNMSDYWTATGETYFDRVNGGRSDPQGC